MAPPKNSPPEEGGSRPVSPHDNSHDPPQGNPPDGDEIRPIQPTDEHQDQDGKYQDQDGKDQDKDRKGQDHDGKDQGQGGEHQGQDDVPQDPPVRPFRQFSGYGEHHGILNGYIPQAGPCHGGVLRWEEQTDRQPYWKEQLELWKQHAEPMIRRPEGGSRDVFTYENVIIKSNHLRGRPDTPDEARRFMIEDLNEEYAIHYLERRFPDYLVLPEFLLIGNLDGFQISVQKRIPGKALNVEWPGLNAEERANYKDQARELASHMLLVPPVDNTKPCFAYNNLERIENLPMKEVKLYLEPLPQKKQPKPRSFKVLMRRRKHEPRDCRFVHNNLTPKNIIVDDGEIVGVIGWKMAGFFGKKTADLVHRRIRLGGLGEDSDDESESSRKGSSYDESAKRQQSGAESFKTAGSRAESSKTGAARAESPKTEAPVAPQKVPDEVEWADFWDFDEDRFLENIPDPPSSPQPVGILPPLQPQQPHRGRLALKMDAVAASLRQMLRRVDPRGESPIGTDSSSSYNVPPSMLRAFFRRQSRRGSNPES